MISLRATHDLEGRQCHSFLTPFLALGYVPEHAGGVDEVRDS